MFAPGPASKRPRTSPPTFFWEPAPVSSAASSSSSSPSLTSLASASAEERHHPLHYLSRLSLQALAQAATTAPSPSTLAEKGKDLYAPSGLALSAPSSSQHARGGLPRMALPSSEEYLHYLPYWIKQERWRAPPLKLSIPDAATFYGELEPANAACGNLHFKQGLAKSKENVYFKDSGVLRYNFDALREWSAEDGIFFWFMSRLGLTEVPSLEEVKEAKKNCERVGFAKLVMKQTPTQPGPFVKIFAGLPSNLFVKRLSHVESVEEDEVWKAVDEESWLYSEDAWTFNSLKVWTWSRTNGLWAVFLHWCHLRGIEIDSDTFGPSFYCPRIMRQVQDTGVTFGKEYLQPLVVKRKPVMPKGGRGLPVEWYSFLMSLGDDGEQGATKTIVVYYEDTQPHCFVSASHLLSLGLDCKLDAAEDYWRRLEKRFRINAEGKNHPAQHIRDFAERTVEAREGGHLLMKKRFEQSPHPIPLLSCYVLPSFLASIQSVAMEEQMNQDIVKLISFTSSVTFQRVASLIKSIPDRVRMHHLMIRPSFLRMADQFVMGKDASFLDMVRKVESLCFDNWAAFRSEMLHLVGKHQVDRQGHSSSSYFSTMEREIEMSPENRPLLVKDFRIPGVVAKLYENSVPPPAMPSNQKGRPPKPTPPTDSDYSIPLAALPTAASRVDKPTMPSSEVASASALRKEVNSSSSSSSSPSNSHNEPDMARPGAASRDLPPAPRLQLGNPHRNPPNVSRGHPPTDMMSCPLSSTPDTLDAFEPMRRPSARALDSEREEIRPRKNEPEPTPLDWSFIESINECKRLLTGIHSNLDDVCALISSINSIRYQQKILSLLEGPTMSCVETGHPRRTLASLQNELSIIHPLVELYLMDIRSVRMAWQACLEADMANYNGTGGERGMKRLLTDLKLCERLRNLSEAFMRCLPCSLYKVVDLVKLTRCFKSLSEAQKARWDDEIARQEPSKLSLLVAQAVKVLEEISFLLADWLVANMEKVLSLQSVDEFSQEYGQSWILLQREAGTYAPPQLSSERLQWIQAEARRLHAKLLEMTELGSSHAAFNTFFTLWRSLYELGEPGVVQDFKRQVNRGVWLLVSRRQVGRPLMHIMMPPSPCQLEAASHLFNPNDHLMSSSSTVTTVASSSSSSSSSSQTSVVIQPDNLRELLRSIRSAVDLK